MKSVSEVTRRYNNLIEDVKNESFYTDIDLSNRTNCYLCENKHVTKTIDIDAGVTPFMIKCSKCDKPAQSSFYNDIAKDQQPTIEWYRPTLKELLSMRKNNPNLVEHVLNGVLIHRKHVIDKN